MLYDNHGRTLEAVDLVYEFRALEPVDSLARRYDISEEQVFEVVGGGAFVETEDARYHFDFEASPPTVQRRPNEGAVPMSGDGENIPLLTITQWVPKVAMFVQPPGLSHPAVRVTSAVLEVAFYD